MKPKRSKVLFSLVLALVIIFNCSTPASAMYFSDVTRDSVGSEVSMLSIMSPTMGSWSVWKTIYLNQIQVSHVG